MVSQGEKFLYLLLLAVWAACCLSLGKTPFSVDQLFLHHHLRHHACQKSGTTLKYCSSSPSFALPEEEISFLAYFCLVCLKKRFLFLWGGSLPGIGRPARWSFKKYFWTRLWTWTAVLFPISLAIFFQRSISVSSVGNLSNSSSSLFCSSFVQGWLKVIGLFVWNLRPLTMNSPSLVLSTPSPLMEFLFLTSLFSAFVSPPYSDFTFTVLFLVPLPLSVSGAQYLFVSILGTDAIACNLKCQFMEKIFKAAHLGRRQV